MSVGLHRQSRNSRLNNLLRESNNQQHPHHNHQHSHQPQSADHNKCLSSKLVTGTCSGVNSLLLAGIVSESKVSERLLQRLLKRGLRPTIPWKELLCFTWTQGTKSLLVSRWTGISIARLLVLLLDSCRLSAWKSSQGHVST